MNLLQIFLLVIFSLASLMAQDLNWFEYKKNPGGGLEIYYTTEDNHLIGNIRHPQEYVYSTDGGESWNELCPSIRFDRNLFIEDDRGLFYTDWKSIYKLDLETGDCTQLYTQAFGNGISHFSYREDNTFWILNRDIVRFGVFNTPIDTLDLEGKANRNKRLHYQVGFPTYITYQTDFQGPYFLRTVSDDFTALGPETQLPPSVENVYHYDKGRMYSSNGYSDDAGLTWTTYNLPVAESEILKISFRGSGIYFITDQALYYSNDAGNFFQAQDHDFDLIGNISLNIGVDYISISTRNCDENLLASSVDKGQTWVEQETDLGSPFVYAVAANTKEDVVVSSCGLQYWTSENSQWQNGNPEQYFSFGDQIEALPNDDIFLANFDGFCLSSDGGENWECEDVSVIEFITGVR